VRSRPPDEEDGPPVSRETVVHNRHLRREHNKARRTANMTKQSCQPPRTNRIPRGQVKISANALASWQRLSHQRPAIHSHTRKQ
jgi:hypothetical protein